MVTNVTSLTRSGLSDFVIQRLSAVVMALYAACIVGFFLAHPGVSHETVAAYFDHPLMRAFSTLTVLATAAHAWIGMWTVGTDYIRPHYFGRHATAFRLVYQFGCVLALFGYGAWALQIFWS